MCSHGFDHLRFNHHHEVDHMMKQDIVVHDHKIHSLDVNITRVKVVLLVHPLKEINNKKPTVKYRKINAICCF